MKRMKKMRLILTLITLLGSLLGASAREHYPLDNEWRFHFGYENGGDKAHLVTLPHTWNNDALAGIYPYLRSEGVYTRDLYLPESWHEKRLFLRFEGVESEADLFVNGAWVGSHRGGGVAFCFEITDRVRLGGNNRLMVVVNNCPSGDRMPLATEENCYGGITRPVELLVTDAVAISPLYLGSEGLFVHTSKLSREEAEGEVELHITSSKAQSVSVAVSAYGPDGKRCFIQRRTLKSTYDFNTPLRIPFVITNPKSWSPKHPHLYRFEATLEAGTARDCVEVTTGLRRITLSAKEGFAINGIPIDIRGLALAYDHPHTGPLMGEKELQADFDLACEVGANALLSPAGPHAADLYALCDREGMLARIDLPFRSTRFLSDRYYSASPAFEAHGEQLLREIIAQHHNHPSVVMWGISYDLKILDERLEAYLRHLHQTAREVDGSRPTVATSNQDGPANFIPDGIIWHQRLGWTRGQAEDIGVWLNQMRERWSHLSSAIHYGAEGFHTQQPDNYGRPLPGSDNLPERRQSRYHEEYLRQLAGDSLLWGIWVDGLSDYGAARRPGGVNGSGLVSFDRQTRKDIFYLYRARWNKAWRGIHIADKRWSVRPDLPQQLTVYLSDGIKNPVMLHNGDTVLLEYYAPNIYRSEEFLLDKESVIVVKGGRMSDTLRIRCGSALKSPVQRVPLQTIGLPRKD